MKWLNAPNFFLFFFFFGIEPKKSATMYDEMSFEFESFMRVSWSETIGVQFFFGFSSLA